MRLLTRNCGPHSCDIYRQICCFEISSQSENTATSESVDYTNKTSIFTKKNVKLQNNFNGANSDGSFTLSG